MEGSAVHIIEFCLLMLGVSVTTVLLTAGVRAWVIRADVLTHPSERCAHRVPTPSSGGLGFVSIFCALAGWWGLLSFPMIVALVGLSLLGLWDDVKSVGANIRLVLQFLISGVLVAAVSSTPDGVFTPSGVSVVTVIFALAAVFAIVWSIKLYNFMDGINGLAALQGISLCLAMAVIEMTAGFHDIALVLMLSAAALSGFVVWNFPVARTFMGDAGSTFLGALWGVLMLMALMKNQSLFVAWVIMTSVFWVDATATLLLRVVRGENIVAAHSAHAYQHAARRFESHAAVSLTVFVFNLVVLFPLAYAQMCGWVPAWAALSLALLPLVVVWGCFTLAPGSSRQSLC